MTLWMPINELQNLTRLMYISRLVYSCYETSKRMAYQCIAAHHFHKTSIQMPTRLQEPLVRQDPNGATPLLKLVLLVLKLDQQQTAGPIDLPK